MAVGKTHPHTHTHTHKKIYYHIPQFSHHRPLEALPAGSKIVTDGMQICLHSPLNRSRKTMKQRQQQQKNKKKPTKEKKQPKKKETMLHWQRKWQMATCWLGFYYYGYRYRTGWKPACETELLKSLYGFKTIILMPSSRLRKILWNQFKWMSKSLPTSRLYFTTNSVAPLTLFYYNKCTPFWLLIYNKIMIFKWFISYKIMWVFNLNKSPLLTFREPALCHDGSTPSRRDAFHVVVA